MAEKAESKSVDLRYRGRRPNEITMGRFQIELNHVSDAYYAPGVVDLAEVEIVILCDTEQTKEFIHEHMVQARDQLTQVFTQMDRSELMSPNGKKKINAAIMHKLNHWLKSGEVQEVYLSSIVVT